MSNMLRTMIRGSMAPHFWNGPVWKRRAPPPKTKKTGTILDVLRGRLSGGSLQSVGRSEKKTGFLGRIASKVASVFKSQRGR